MVDAKTECPITFKQALLRDAIPAVLIVCLLTAGTFSTITGDESLIFWVFAVLATWFLLELITMLFNKKRRALHDFIAGTVVVRSDLWEADCARRKQMSQERTFG